MISTSTGESSGSDGDADGGARMRPELAERLQQQVAGAVDDAGLAGEVRRAGDEADDLDDAHDRLEERDRLHGGDRVQRADRGELGSPLGRHLGADLARRGEHAVDEGQLARTCRRSDR